jgi:hypothetical protein
VGILETIDGMDLSDEQKDKLRQEYSADVDPLKTENDSLKAKDRRSSVEEEVKALGGIGLSAAPGLLKFYRRVLLSGDAEEPGAVLLSDSEMHLSGDAATGATGREEISVAGALRKFVELLPRNNEGKLELSDMNLTDDHGRPDDKGDGEDEDSDDHKKNLEEITGRSLKRTRKRYGATVAGGDD